MCQFAEPGPHNTDATLELAKGRAEELGITRVVVATDTGRTAKMAIERFGEGYQVVAVTNPAELRLPVARLHDYLPRFKAYRDDLAAKGVTEVRVGMTDEAMDELRDEGAHVSRIDWKKLYKYTKKGLDALDRIGVAVRVAVACTGWGYVVGAIAEDVEVVALAGTGFGGGGADTAIVVRTAAEWRDWRVLETICRPRVSPPSLL